MQSRLEVGHTVGQRVDLLHAISVRGRSYCLWQTSRRLFLNRRDTSCARTAFCRIWDRNGSFWNRLHQDLVSRGEVCLGPAGLCRWWRGMVILVKTGHKNVTVLFGKTCWDRVKITAVWLPQPATIVKLVGCLAGWIDRGLDLGSFFLHFYFCVIVFFACLSPPPPPPPLSLSLSLSLLHALPYFAFPRFLCVCGFLIIFYW